MSKWSFSENYYWKNEFPQCGGPYQSPINLDTELIQECNIHYVILTHIIINQHVL